MNLTKAFFNVRKMGRVRIEYDLDVNKMPLGKLSYDQLQKAKLVLDRLKVAVDTKRQDLKIGFTNKFLTLIPQSFDLARMPILDSKKKIDEKREILKKLIKEQASFDIMKKKLPLTNSFEAYYKQLNAEVLPVDHKSQEFQLIEKYAKNASPGRKIEINEVFKIDREGKRGYKFNRSEMLLWHGSDTANFAKIIREGLIVTKTPANGRMFGDGIYFADMLCKALGFCVSDVDGYSYLVLCKIELGLMKKYKSQCQDKLPVGFNSVMGVGQTHPGPKEAHTRKDGVIIPLGRPISTNQTFTGVLNPLNYNEYVVYNKKQVIIQYLVKLKAT